MTTDPYTSEAERLRAIVQASLRDGTEPTLTPYEQFLLCGYYEREMARLQDETGALVNTIDINYADRLERARADMAAVRALDLAPTRPDAALWNDQTATRLDDTEGPP